MEPDWPAPLALEPDLFVQHMAWLGTHRRLLDLAKAVPRLDRSGRLPKGYASLTMDDGFSGVYEYAFPVLRRLRLPATVFVVAQTLAPEGRPVDWAPIPPRGRPARTLTLDQILEMQETGIEFQSHSYTHRTMTELGDGECLRDLRLSREVLEDLLKRPVRLLAYPRGLHDARVRRAAQRAGFVNSFGLPQTREVLNPHAIPRVGVFRRNGVSTLRIKAARWYLPVRTSNAFTALRHVLGERSPRRGA